MGKISVTGYAEREVTYDRMRINIDFSSIEKTSSRAMDEVMKQSDKFIESLVNKGIKSEFIHFKEDTLGKDYRYQENNNFTAERCIYVDVEFNMVLLNTIVELIKSHEGDISYHTDYSVSNINKIHGELLKEAFLDSKKKAELIISTYGREISGIKSINTAKISVHEKILDCMMLCEDSYDDETNSISNVLSAPTIVEREQIEVVWLF